MYQIVVRTANRGQKAGWLLIKMEQTSVVFDSSCIFDIMRQLDASTCTRPSYG